VRLAAALVSVASLVGAAHGQDASGPFPEERFQGELAPDLKGTGARWSEGQLRLRIVDSSRINPASIMPAYHRTDGLTRVAPAFRGKPILTAEQIEDVVAYLTTLKD